MTRIIRIAVANQKGGVGKTTTSLCVAQKLRSRGFRVLFIDTDAQCNSTKFYEAETHCFLQAPFTESCKRFL